MKYTIIRWIVSLGKNYPLFEQVNNWDGNSKFDGVSLIFKSNQIPMFVDSVLKVISHEKIWSWQFSEGVVLEFKGMVKSRLSWHQSNLITRRLLLSRNMEPRGNLSLDRWSFSIGGMELFDLIALLIGSLQLSRSIYWCWFCKFERVVE